MSPLPGGAARSPGAGCNSHQIPPGAAGPFPGRQGRGVRATEKHLMHEGKAKWSSHPWTSSDAHWEEPCQVLPWGSWETPGLAPSSATHPRGCLQPQLPHLQGGRPNCSWATRITTKKLRGLKAREVTTDLYQPITHIRALFPESNDHKAIKCMRST